MNHDTQYKQVDSGATRPASPKDSNLQTPPRSVAAGTREFRFVNKKNKAGKPYLAFVEQCPDGSAKVRLIVLEPQVNAFNLEFQKTAKRINPDLKIFDLNEIRKIYPNAFTTWTPSEDRQLIASSKDGRDLLELAELLGRPPGGVRSRLQLLGISGPQ